MVKGISRQVIVVRPPDTELFDQAIFILRDRAAPGGVTDEQILEEARRAADLYLRTRTHRALGVRLRPLFDLLFGALGAAVVWVIWLLVH